MKDPEQTITSTPSPERKTGAPSKYDLLFARIAKTNILPPAESEWSSDDLEQDLNKVFFDYGQVALVANGDKIHTTLSGGLDSTLAVALLRKSFPDAEIHTYTMGGSENHPDVVHARLAATKFGTEHHEFIPTMDEMTNGLTEYAEKSPDSDLEVASKTGDSDVYLLYKYISQFGPKILLVHDGIDELMGGYWNHQQDVSPEEKAATYKGLWDKLIPDHLQPLTATSSQFDIGLLFPYLDSTIVSAAADIPLLDRSDATESKKPLRAIARKLGVPEEIITRPKQGQVGMLELQ
jgi:asparagine synthetase B (glutamine-hydrolysing)